MLWPLHELKSGHKYEIAKNYGIYYTHDTTEGHVWCKTN